MPVRLAHHELGRARDLVGDRDQRRAELVAARVSRTPEVTERRDPRDAERDVGRALTPRTAERVADDDARPSTPVSSRRALARRRAADASGSSGSRTSVPAPCAFEASTPAEAQTKPWRVSRDHERRPGAHDLDRLAQDHLDLPRIAVAAGELDGPRRRLDVVEADDAALDLRHRLLGDDDDVARLEATARAAQHRRAVRRGRRLHSSSGRPGSGRSPAPPSGRIVSGRTSPEVAQWTPVTRRPACAL